MDWYHAKQHLAEAARLVKPEGTRSHQRCLNSRATLLYQGHAARIAAELDKAAHQPPAKSAKPAKSAPATQAEPAPAVSAKQEALAREASYFRANHLRMNYLEMREEEWPIGSGVIASGAKQFKARFSGPGMRWSRHGAENLIPCAPPSPPILLMLPGPRQKSAPQRDIHPTYLQHPFDSKIIAP